MNRALERAVATVTKSRGLGVHVVVDDHQPTVNMHTLHSGERETRSVRLLVRSPQVEIEVQVRNVPELIDDLTASLAFLRGEDDR